MQRKPKFKIENLKNTENLTSHHFMYIKKVSSTPVDRAGKQTQLIKSTARLCMRVNIRFSFHTPPSGPPFFLFLFFFSYLFLFFFPFDSERVNVLSNKYLFNLGTIAQYFSASCIGFGTSLYSVVAYLIKCDS